MIFAQCTNNVQTSKKLIYTNKKIEFLHEWHSKGQGFDSPMLHQKTLDFIRKIKGFIFSIALENHWKSPKIESRNVQNNVQDFFIDRNYAMEQMIFFRLS